MFRIVLFNLLVNSMSKHCFFFLLTFFPQTSLTLIATLSKLKCNNFTRHFLFGFSFKKLNLQSKDSKFNNCISCSVVMLLSLYLFQKKKNKDPNDSQEKKTETTLVKEKKDNAWMTTKKKKWNSCLCMCVFIELLDQLARQILFYCLFRINIQIKDIRNIKKWQVCEKRNKVH